MITTNVWLGVPFMMVALLGGLQAIDSDLLDAAAVDGANAVAALLGRDAARPAPVAATVILLGLIWTFNMFNIIFLITGGGPGNSTQIFPTFAYQNAFTYYLYGSAAAWGVIILSMLLVFGQFYRWLGQAHGRGDLVVSSAERPAGRRSARRRRGPVAADARPPRGRRRSAAAERACARGTCRCSSTAA